jgi:hypothetical protein
MIYKYIVSNKKKFILPPETGIWFLDAKFLFQLFPFVVDDQDINVIKLFFLFRHCHSGRIS